MSGLTGFESYGTDLSFIFQPWNNDTPIDPSTNFITNSNKDLCQIFQPYDGYSLKANSTGFVTSVSGDLCNIFQPIIYTISQQNNYIKITPYYSNDYTGLVFDFSGNKPYSIPVPLASANITFNKNINNAKIIIIGGGGSGAGDGGGGGGGGGTIDLSFNMVKDTNYNITVACGTSSTGLITPIYGGNSIFDNTYVAYSGMGGYPRGYSNPIGGNGGGTNTTTTIFNENGGGGGGGACGFLNNTPTASLGGYNIDGLNNGQDGLIVGGSSYNYTIIPIKSISVPFMNSSSIITCGGGGGACFNNTDKGGTAGNGYGGFTLETGGIGYPGNNDIHTGYGGGGGGGGSFGNYYSGGAGGNGVVIIYWSNNQ